MPYGYPAPWTVPPYIGVGWDVVDANGVNVAQYIQEEECARLIAAAPDLYEELQNLLWYLYELQGQGFMRQTQEDIDRVEALLKRIHGSEDSNDADA